MTASRSSRASRPACAIGLAHDTAVVKPPNVDGFVGWLTTHLIAALTNTAVMRTRARIEDIDDVKICRVDVAASSTPVTARMSGRGEAFWVRTNNSTRARRTSRSRTTFGIGGDLR